MTALSLPACPRCGERVYRRFATEEHHRSDLLLASETTARPQGYRGLSEFSGENSHTPWHCDSCLTPVADGAAFDALYDQTGPISR